MARREYTGNWPCRETGCPERAGYVYSSLRAYDEAAEWYADRPWACPRHSQPDAVLSAANPARRVELVAGRQRFRDYDRDLAKYKATVARGSDFAVEPDEFLPGMRWLRADGEGPRDISGEGFKAFAEDFPPGTRLVITVTVEAPADAAI